MMHRNRNKAWDQVQAFAQIADLKEANYKNTLALSALIEILVEKGVLTPEDFHRKAAMLEREDTAIADGLRYVSPTESHSVE